MPWPKVKVTVPWPEVKVPWPRLPCSKAPAVVNGLCSPGCQSDTAGPKSGPFDGGGHVPASAAVASTAGATSPAARAARRAKILLMTDALS